MNKLNKIITSLLLVTTLQPITAQYISQEGPTDNPEPRSFVYRDAFIYGVCPWNSTNPKSQEQRGTITMPTRSTGMSYVADYQATSGGLFKFVGVYHGADGLDYSFDYNGGYSEGYTDYNENPTYCDLIK